MKQFAATTLSAVLLTLGTGFAQDTLPVGVITSITGRYAEFGEQHQAGFAVALEEINANGGRQRPAS